MITNKKFWEEWEKNYIASSKSDYLQNLAIVESMLDEAIILGVFPLKNPLEGIETDIKVARIINRVKGTPEENSQ